MSEEAKKPTKAAPKKAEKKVEIDPKTVSQSTKVVEFKWSKGDKSGKSESMSENVAEILEAKGLGTKKK